jgi:hypothetical protein
MLLSGVMADNGGVMRAQPSNQLRWVGQLSEEELLGIPASVLPRRTKVAVRSTQAPPARRVVTMVSPVRRLHAREPLAIVSVAGLVMLMLGGVGAGSRFWGSAPLAPEANAQGLGQVVVDRRELGSLPRAVPSSSHRGDRPSQNGTAEDRGSKPGSKDEPSAPGKEGAGGGGGDNPSDPPLVQATLPVVGTVTVDEPDTPAFPEVPELPLPGDVVPETPTVPLP